MPLRNCASRDGPLPWLIAYYGRCNHGRRKRAHKGCCAAYQEKAVDPAPPAAGAVTSEGLAAATQAALRSVRRTRRKCDFCPSV